jgi:hypothetical protein
VIELTPPGRLSRDPDQLPRALWEHVDRLVGRMLERSACERYPSGSEMLAAFEGVDIALRRAEDRHLEPSRVWGFLAELVRRRWGGR